MPGEHTAEICRDVLGMSAEEVAALAATGAVFAWAGSEHPLLESTRDPASRSHQQRGHPLTIDPRTPVLVGYGQVNQRDVDPSTEPVDLMESAARAAADPRVLEAVDSVRIVNLLSWRYRNPGLLLAQRIGASGPRPVHESIGATCRSPW